MEGSGSRRRNGGGAAAGSESSARSAALQQLKNLRQQGGRRVDGFDLKLEEKIYDTVAEDDYAQLVAKRRADAKDFVVDDAGLGYCDIGEEDDWETGTLNYSSEEEQGVSSSKKKKLPSENKKKNDGNASRKASALSAAAALMGKQRVSSMFTSSSMFKKHSNKEEKPGQKGFSTDSILEDVLAEITPDEADREKRRRRTGIKNATVVGNAASNSIQSSPHTFSWNRPEIQVNEASVQQSINLQSSCKHNSVENGHKYEPGSGIAIESQNSDPVLEDQHVSVEFPNNIDENASHEENNIKPTESLLPKNCDTIIADCELKPMPKVALETNMLNARISCESLTSKATSDWQAIWQDTNEKGTVIKETANEQVVSEDSNDLPLESDGSLLFYLIDAYEEAYGAHPGTVYLFGKVKVKNTYVSCCVAVQNMQRCVFAIPAPSVFPDNMLVEFEQASKEGAAEQSFLGKKLQEMASGIKQEISQKLMDLNVNNFSMVPVKRNYAFERPDVLTGERYVLKLSYPFKDPPLPADLKGNHFSALFGTHSSALELFLIKRRIRGPAWLSISKAACLPSSSRVSWCKFEVNVESPKDIKVAASTSIPQEIPPLVVAAINLKTVINDKHNINEIASVSIVCCHRTRIDYPMPKAEWNKPGILCHFSILRKLDGGIFPMGFVKDVANKNAKAGSNVLSYESSERALLNRLMIKLHQLDPDVLVGHNISGFDLDVVLHRAQTCKVPSNMWSKIGRLKRSIMPKLSKGNNSSGMGATPGLMACIAGRLLCDTYLSARELLKEVSYSLTQLAKNQLGRDRKEINPVDMPIMYQTSTSLLELVECAETDAWLSLGLMFHLSVLPLTRQLTNISGNLWSKTLQGARAQRVEYLLLHEFHARKYIVPDKMSARDKELTASKRKLASNSGVADAGEEVDFGVVDDGIEPSNHGKHKKGPAYLGGLVLEPKKGLYDKYILLLDFNSLYPSIIQEYNVCFTTVERPSDGSIPNLPSSKIPGVLPQLLKNLVGRRRQVKLWLKNTSDPLKFQQLDIQQQALKLTANSMYGCLGFANSRFYAKPLAELITSQGREILQSTVDLVQNSLNLEVIYGDTDSIMIHSGLDDVTDAKMVAGRVIKEVNKKYKCLEIDLDGLYKRMLLLKKKKYAAVKVQFNKDGTAYEVIEQKGLDIVRRDWSLLSKEIGNFCLEQILSGGSCEDVVEAIHNRLQKVQEEMRSGEVELDKYVITKTLTKPPEDYTDSKNQPHVLVALRMKQSGHRIGCSVGDTVPYIICREQGSGEGTTTGIAERARHPDELKRDSGNWMIDIDYYLSQQIHPVVSRLCAPIQGTSPGRLADSLGLEPSKFEPKLGSDAVTKDPATAFFATLLNDGERYHDCEPFTIVCPHCSTSFECPSVTSMVNSSEDYVNSAENVDQGDSKLNTSMQAAEKCGYFLHCPKCKNTGDPSIISPAMLSNQVKRQAEKFIAFYYTGIMTCDDDMCKHTTRRLTLRVIGDTERGTVCPNYPRCNGRLVRQYTEVDLYKQLTYFCWLLDAPRVLQKLEYSARILAEKRLDKVRPAIDAAATTIREIRDRSAYGWVNLDNLVVGV
ncbi:hypothetical protein SUGI_0711430 [Cryptomeria japonica]|nr:hypothetical protein SUGI_0711430 [Cryptomeria japonica]